MINECSPKSDGGLGPPIARAAVLTMWIWMQGVHELIGFAFLDADDADDPIPFELADDPEDDGEQDGGGCRV